MTAAELGAGRIGAIGPVRLYGPYGGLNALASFQAPRQGFWFDAVYRRQLLRREGHAIHFVFHNTLSSVQRLGARICPSNIARLVRAKRIDAVQRMMSARRSPDVFEKRLVTTAPPLANRNPFGSVLMERGVCMSVAAKDCISPCAVFLCSLAAASVAMNSETRSGKLCSQATTTPRSASRQRGRLHISFDSARAAASPIHPSSLGVASAKHRPASERQSCEVSLAWSHWHNLLGFAGKVKVV